jgi:hypothetical protein
MLHFFFLYSDLVPLNSLVYFSYTTIGLPRDQRIYFFLHSDLVPINSIFSLYLLSEFIFIAQQFLPSSTQQFSFEYTLRFLLVCNHDRVRFSLLTLALSFFYPAICLWVNLYDFYECVGKDIVVMVVRLFLALFFLLFNSFSIDQSSNSITYTSLNKVTL